MATVLLEAYAATRRNIREPPFLREVITRIAEHPINRITELLPWHLTALASEQLTGTDVPPELPAQT